MPVGQIATVTDKGYGFIAQAGEPDRFFHISGMVNRQDFDSLSSGDQVRFELETVDGRDRATSVQRI